MKITNIETFIVDAGWLPWREELTTAVPEIIDGYMTVPTGPGWGCDVIEEVALAHPWDENSVSAVQSQGYGMQRR